MNYIQIDQLSKTYGDKVIFDNLSLGVNQGDKIGLIGVNGTGKSTLLKILALQDQGDHQNLLKASDLTIEYLPQEPDLNPNLTVMEQIFCSDSPLVQLVGQYEACVDKLRKTPENSFLQEEMMKLSLQMDLEEGWSLESEAKKILTQLNISDFEKKIGELSGGMKKRVAIAGVLIRSADLLIFDEPTNHIDNDTIEFLENLIKRTKSAVVMVTHDRYFLDRVMNRIWELKNGSLHSYQGNYSQYLEIKAQREMDENVIEDKKRRLYQRELEWIRKGVEARRTKQKARKERFAKLEEELVHQEQGELKINTTQSRLGKKILEAEGLTKSFGTQKIIKDFTYTLQSADRIGIIGNNGAGKTTLLNLLSGKETADQGAIHWGETVRLGYYAQEQESAEDGAVVIDYIKDVAEYVTTKEGKKITASQMLENFLFSPKAQYTWVNKLSGGEKRRLHLLKILMASPNVLFLDEPTNDLDIETLGILEDYIRYFEGPVVTVSHDRFFLDKICNKIFHMDKGKLTYYMGGYEDYLDQRVITQEVVQEKPKAEKPRNKGGTVKLSFNQQREKDQLPGEIDALENKLEQLESKVNQCGSDFVELQKLLDEKNMVEIELLEKMEKMEYYEKM